MAEPTKAYYVTERWVIRKELLVFAHTGAEAIECVRKGLGDAEGISDYPEPTSATVRRAPGEDRSTQHQQPDSEEGR